MQDRAELVLRPENAQAIYEHGFVGAFYSPHSRVRLLEAIMALGGESNAGRVCQANNLYDIGQGKLSLGFRAAEILYPGCYPGGAQLRGDCVAWSTRNAVLGSYCNEILYGANADGEDAPNLSKEAIAEGVIGTEPFYWFRGYDGDGATCAALAQVALTKSGMWLRKNYPELGVDLTHYSPSTAGKWGRQAPPEAILQAGQQTLVKLATIAKTYSEVRDLIATGNCLSTCGSEAFGDRDDDGVCQRSNKTWSHAISALGVDDRPETISRYGCGLVLMQNSWGSYLTTGSRIIRGTAISIPEGSFWAKWLDIKNRYFIALSAAHGWPARKLPDWGLGGIV